MSLNEMYVELLASVTIAYVRQVGPYGPSNRKAMEKLKQWADRNHLLDAQATLLGIPQDDPSSTPPQHCRYDACIVLDHDYHFKKENDPAIHIGTFAGGHYLICIVPHTAEGVRNAWNEIIAHVHAKGIQMGRKPMIERYRAHLLGQHLCELCIPITTN
ncbi:AraC family transcriptional regulator [Paenibacillus sp. TC-CSREp1]|uniref:AraC family transcriptional regulator n=1 Tax=Paenibacillus sp. TC-CSREp1 TaxID=3410089 RepID=UPI003CE6F37F